VATTRTLSGYIYNKNGSALTGLTVNIIDAVTGTTEASTTTVGADWGGAPPHGAGFWYATGLNDTKEYRVEVINGAQKLVRSRFSAEMHQLEVTNKAYLPSGANVFLGGGAGASLNATYLALSGGALTGALTGDLTVRADGATTVTHQRNSADNAAGIIRGRKSRGTNGSPTIITAGDQLWTLRWAGYDGAAYVDAAAISGFGDGTPGANDMPGMLVFYTTPDGSATLTERMRIGSNGQIGIGAGITGPQIRLQSETGTGITLGGGNNVDLVASGNTIFRADTGNKIGFFNHATSLKQAVIGSRSDPEGALKDLLTILDAYGLVQNSSTA